MFVKNQIKYKELKLKIDIYEFVLQYISKLLQVHLGDKFCTSYCDIIFCHKDEMNFLFFQKKYSQFFGLNFLKIMNSPFCVILEGEWVGECANGYIANKIQSITL